jgi:hypothetical protein
MPERGQVHRQRSLTAAGVEHVAGDFALIDQRRDLRLRFANAPRRPGARTELLSLAAVGRIEIEIRLLDFSHKFRCINLPDICQAN